MDKPITVIYEELKNEIADIINNSGLPAFVIEFMLQSFLNEAKLSSQRQYQLDKDKYEKFLRENN